AVQLNGDTPPKQVDRDDQEALLWAPSDDDPLHVGERPPGDPHPLPFAEIRIGKDREAGVEESSDRLDFRLRHGVESVPALPEDAHQPPRLVDLEVARFVHRVIQEEVSPEQRDTRETPGSATSGPRLDGREEHVEALRGELVRDELLAIAVGPQDPPRRGHRCRNDFWQGIDPLGLQPLTGGETTHQLPVASSRRIRPRWSATSRSPLPSVHRTRQRGITDPETIFGKASPPLVSSPFSAVRDHHPPTCREPPTNPAARLRPAVTVSSVNWRYSSEAVCLSRIQWRRTNRATPLSVSV